MLRIPDSDWRVVDGSHQISVRFLRKQTPQAARFTQWIQRTHAKLLGAPEEVLSCCTTGLIGGEIPDKEGWISAPDALALLTYSVHSSDNTSLIDAIELKSGLKLPVPPGVSTFAEQFSVELSKLFPSLWQSKAIYCELQREKKVGPYRVDFFVTTKRPAPDGSTIIRYIIIEFDENAHKGKEYAANDRKRDIWFRKNRPEIKLIRVRHEEQETWLEAIRSLQEFVSLEDCYAHCLRLACTVQSGPELRISSDSARKSYDAAQNVCCFLLRRPAQPLREMQNLLTRLGIPYEKRRDIHFRRAKLRPYGL
ncbi:hypothetical protein SMC50_002415 [Cronobacter sakazakii]|nr:hypothetical protein [Cronobacter sakazakii]ELY2636898.1 hypothetical protein [Cronobacter sakazakii]ELY2658684.1 hypothetical protein [Cronobacter sakazakii]ELY4832479.1 hypothetical protein [Cronobacter sakazakii]ELY5923065.1 hypothetical protein [Cronobacter sakazakii]